MAIRWNDIKSQRAAREQSLATTPEPVPDPTPLNESVSNIDVGGVVNVPTWRIVGVSPIEANPATGIVPIPDPIERFPARPRDIVASFSVRNYDDLDITLDQSLIVSFGLTLAAESTSTWTTYFPLVQSDTQVYTDENNKPATWDDGLVVGQETTFATTEILDGTSYTVGTVVYGREENLQGNPSWSGVIALREDLNTMEVTITYVASPESVNGSSTTQHWYISNNNDLLQNLF